MAVLHDCGQLHNSPVFDTSVPIWQRIDELPYVTRTASFDAAKLYCYQPSWLHLKVATSESRKLGCI
jgi:hypothetical protein